MNCDKLKPPRRRCPNLKIVILQHTYTVRTTRTYIHRIEPRRCIPTRPLISAGMSLAVIARYHDLNVVSSGQRKYKITLALSFSILIVYGFTYSTSESSGPTVSSPFESFRGAPLLLELGNELVLLLDDVDPADGLPKSSAPPPASAAPAGIGGATESRVVDGSRVIVPLIFFLEAPRMVDAW